MGFLIAVWVFCGVCCAIIAEKKYRGQTLWFFLGVLFGVFALVAIALLPAA